MLFDDSKVQWSIYVSLSILALIGCMGILTLVGCRAIGIAPFGLAFDSKPESNLVPEDSKAQLWTMVKKSNWTITLAIPIIALGAVAAFNGMVKLGMSAIIFGSVNLFMGLATARFAIWMAVFGLVGSIVAVVASVLVKNKALQEIVWGGQLFKKEMETTGWPSADTKNGSIKDCFNANQAVAQASSSTRKLVQCIKKKLKSNTGG